MDELTTEQAAALAGLSYRQIDHIVREGIYLPRMIRTSNASHPSDRPITTPGSGYSRRWKSEQVPVLRLLATLRGLGLPGAALSVCAAEADELEPERWLRRAMVTRAGRILPLTAPGHGYVVDLPECLEGMEQARVLAAA